MKKVKLAYLNQKNNKKLNKSFKSYLFMNYLSIIMKYKTKHLFIINLFFLFNSFF